MPETAATMSRRECLAWLARAAGCAMTSRCIHAGEDAGQKKQKDKSKVVKVADLSALVNESAKLVEKPELILVRTSHGIAAMSAYCTHRRNKLTVEEDGSITCPVHSSIFDLSGKPQTGPASRTLPWFQVSVAESGAISVDPSQSANHGAWAALPDWARPQKQP